MGEVCGPQGQVHRRRPLWSLRPRPHPLQGVRHHQGGSRGCCPVCDVSGAAGRAMTARHGTYHAWRVSDRERSDGCSSRGSCGEPDAGSRAGDVSSKAAGLAATHCIGWSRWMLAGMSVVQVCQSGPSSLQQQQQQQQHPRHATADDSQCTTAGHTLVSRADLGLVSFSCP